MQKLNMVVGKKFTINTQNYSSVSPTLTLDLSELNGIEDIIKYHELLEVIADGLLHKQMESDIITMATIKRMGFEKYFKEVRENGNIDETLDSAVNELMNINGE